MFYVLLAAVAAQALIIRHLSIDPGFKIKTRAAGEISLWTAYLFRSVLMLYGDIDSLGKINDALTIGDTLGHDRFNEFMRWVLAGIRNGDKALVYGGDELRIMTPMYSRFSRINGEAFCLRLQDRMRLFKWSDLERARLLELTGKDYISVTLAYMADVSYLNRRAALNCAKATIGNAKPKNAVGQRGMVLPC